jgi:hypothetical protein
MVGSPCAWRARKSAVGLAEHGRTFRGGIPGPLDLALFTQEFEDEVQGAFPPRWLQRIVSHRWPGSRDAAYRATAPAPWRVDVRHESALPRAPASSASRCPSRKPNPNGTLVAVSRDSAAAATRCPVRAVR